MLDTFNAMAHKAWKSKKAAFTAAALGLAGCGSHPNLEDEAAIAAHTTTIYSTFEDGDIIVVHNGRGGLVTPIMSQYENWADRGTYIIIDGHVASADGFGSFSEALEGQSCYTDNAVFAPHAAYFDSQTPDWDMTEQLAAQLIDPLETEFRNSPYFRRWIGTDYIDADRLREIYPEGECPADKLKYTRMAPNF